MVLALAKRQQLGRSGRVRSGSADGAGRTGWEEGGAAAGAGGKGPNANGRNAEKRETRNERRESVGKDPVCCPVVPNAPLPSLQVALEPRRLRSAVGGSGEL